MTISRTLKRQRIKIIRLQVTKLFITVILGLLAFPGLLMAQNGVWQEINPTTSPPLRTGHSTFTLNDTIYVFGGNAQGNLSKPTNNNMLNDTWKYDPEKSAWVSVPVSGQSTTPPGRFGHSTVAQNGSAWLFGGIGDGFQKLGDLWEYDPNSKSWEQKQPEGDKPSARSHHTSTAVGDDQIAVLGGLERSDLWTYDPYSNRWVKRADFPIKNQYGLAIHNKGNKIYATCRPDSVWVYDLTTDTWTAIPPKDPSQRIFTANDQANGLFYLFGGELADGSFTNETWMYNPDIPEWTRLDDGPVALSEATMQFLEAPTLLKSSQGNRLTGGSLLVYGGRKMDGSASGATYLYTLPTPPPVLTRVEITPESVELNLNDTQQFEAQGFDAEGLDFPFTAEWTATGGIIDADGLYTATQEGDFVVVVSDTANTVSDTARVTVNPPPPVLTRIEISPETVELNLNETHQFEAQGFDGDGNDFTFAPVWTATGGTIDALGLYTATEVGQFDIVVSDTSNTNTVSDTAQVTVTATGIGDMSHRPVEFHLYQNHPNPFNPVTTIRFSVKERCHVLLEIYDVMGRVISTPVDDVRNAGFQTVSFNARGLPTGLYFYRIIMKGFTDVKKMLLLE